MAVNVADVLGAMVGNGLYDVRFIDDKLDPFKFRYDRATDELVYEFDALEQRAKLGARKGSQAVVEITRASRMNDTWGFINADADDTLMFDALSLSQAICVLYGIAPPSLTMKDRSLAFRADVRAITRYLRAN